MPAYKNKVWNGKIHLFDVRTNELPIGLFAYLPEFCDVRDYRIKVEDSQYYGRVDALNNIANPDIQAFADSLTLTSGGKPIQPRDYQINAVTHGLQRKRAVLLSPTASGKSLIIYLKTRWFLEHGKGAALIIVPTTSLVEQMTKDFADYSEYDDTFYVERDVHKIYSGKDKFDDSKPVIITTWQSIYKLGHKWFERYGLVIGDEAHNFKAKSLTSILSKCNEAEYRFGLTGTLDGTQTHQLVLEGLFGQVHKVITTKQLMENDSIAQLNISVLLLKYSDQYRKACSQLKYQQEVDFIVQYEPRNRFIMNLALDQDDGNTLILFNYVGKHGKPLFEMIRNKVQENPRSQRKVFFVSGEVDVDERESIRRITETEKDAIIVASLGTFSTGINIRNLHNIIFASPSKSQVKVLQSIGRGLRKSDDGRETQLFDIADDLSWRKRKNYTLNHAGDRISMYVKEHFEYKVYELDIWWLTMFTSFILTMATLS